MDFCLEHLMRRRRQSSGNQLILIGHLEGLTEDRKPWGCQVWTEPPYIGPHWLDHIAWCHYYKTIFFVYNSFFL